MTAHNEAAVPAEAPALPAEAPVLAAESWWRRSARLEKFAVAASVAVGGFITLGIVNTVITTDSTAPTEGAGAPSPGAGERGVARPAEGGTAGGAQRRENRAASEAKRRKNAADAVAISPKETAQRAAALEDRSAAAPLDLVNEDAVRPNLSDFEEERAPARATPAPKEKAAATAAPQVSPLPVASPPIPERASPAPVVKAKALPVLSAPIPERVGLAPAVKATRTPARPAKLERCARLVGPSASGRIDCLSSTGVRLQIVHGTTPLLLDGLEARVLGSFAEGRRGRIRMRVRNTGSRTRLLNVTGRQVYLNVGGRRFFSDEQVLIRSGTATFLVLGFELPSVRAERGDLGVLPFGKRLTRNPQDLGVMRIIFKRA